MHSHSILLTMKPQGVLALRHCHERRARPPLGGHGPINAAFVRGPGTQVPRALLFPYLHEALGVLGIGVPRDLHDHS